MIRTLRWSSPRVGLVVPVAVVALIAAAATVAPTSAAPTAQAPSCQWQRLTSGDERSNHVLVPVPGRGVLSYGGIRNDRGNGDVKDDIALLDLMGGAAGVWETVTTTGASPGKRAEHMAITRPADGQAQVVTYGGIDSFETTPGGTFTWRSPLAAGGRVEGRREALAPVGVVKNGAVLTLSGSGGAWVPLPSDVGPLTDGSAVYWPEGDRMVLFGGRTGTETRTAVKRIHALALDAATPSWASADPGRGPSARWGHSAVYDAGGQRMIVFGGTTDWRAGRNDLYALNLAGGWDAAAWQSIDAGGRVPRVRYDHAAVYLPGLRWMVVYGGTRNGSDVLDDLHVLDLAADPPAWIAVTPTGTAPPALAYLAGAASDTAGNDMAVFYGGEASGSSKRDAWGLACTGGVVAPTATPTTAATVPPVATATPTATDTAAPPATVTPGATDLTVTGRVTAAAGGAPIAGAVVAVGLSVPRQPFSATTDADGRYSVLVPADYVATVDRMTVTAAGFAPVTVAVTGPDLAAQPVRDFSLTALPTATPEPPTAVPEGGRIYLPVTFRAYALP